MSLEVCRIDHHRVGCLVLGGQGSKDLVEDADPAPADEAVVECFVRAIDRGCIAPHQAVADDMDNAADHLAVVYPGNATRLVGQKRLEMRKLRLAEPEMVIGHRKLPADKS